jgi:stress-induced morphogen
VKLGDGHFVIEVTSPAFAGRSMLGRQRIAYGAGGLESKLPPSPE